jgi:hypothetical protein
LAKIFISYPNEDRGIADQLHRELIAKGHEIFLDQQSIRLGAHWHEDITRNLKEADVFLALVTDNSNKSYYFNIEVTGAISYVAHSNKNKLILPLVINNASLGESDLGSFQAIFGTTDDFQNLVYRVDSAITQFETARIAQDELRELKSQVINKNSGEYVKETLDDLYKRENSFKKIATAWYGSGFICLVLSVLAVLYLWWSASSTPSAEQQTQNLLFSLAKGITLVGLMLTLSRYSFLLGKGYMTEALKNADRIHAISFGKFYLQVYGGSITPEEMREVFQNWNTVGATEFSAQKVDDIESKFLSAISKVTQNINKEAKSIKP